ncbi:MAG: MarR family transcriptional regulator [Pseudomonadota bacterium]
MNAQAEKTAQVVHRLLDTAAALERGLDNTLSLSRGVTFSEFRLLTNLQDAKQGLTRVSLANKLAMSPSGVTRALKPLEKLGYVTTEKNKRDARQSLAKLSRGGHALLADVEPILTDFYEGLPVARLSDSETAQLEEGLIGFRRSEQ